MTLLNYFHLLPSHLHAMSRDLTHLNISDGEIQLGYNMSFVLSTVNPTFACSLFQDVCFPLMGFIYQTSNVAGKTYKAKLWWLHEGSSVHNPNTKFEFCNLNPLQNYVCYNYSLFDKPANNTDFLFSYYIFLTPFIPREYGGMSWISADKTCNSVDGHLPVITSRSEMMRISAFVRDFHDMTFTKAIAIGFHSEVSKIFLYSAQERQVQNHQSFCQEFCQPPLF